MSALALLAALSGGIPMLAFLDSDEKGSWVPFRLAELAGEDARRLGYAVVDRGALRADPSTAKDAFTVSIRVTPKERSTLEVSIEISGARSTLAGNLEGLDELAARIAGAAIEGAGGEPDLERLSTIRAHQDPSDLHKILADAAKDSLEGKQRSAALAFDRIVAMRVPPFDAEATLAATRARLSSDEPGLDRELAASSFERVKTAKNLSERLSAGLTAFRYTPARTVRWSLAVPLEVDTRVFVSEELTVIARPNRRLLFLGSSRGAILESTPPVAAAIGVAGTPEAHQVLLLNGRRLERLVPGRPPAFSVELPATPTAWAPRPARGQLALSGPFGLVWVDLSIGSVSPAIKDLAFVSTGPDSVLTRSGQQLGLLRPGQKALAWSVEAPRGLREAFVQLDRVVAVASDGLSTFDALDGKKRAQLPTCPEARLLPTEGRYAILAACDAAIEVIDVLAGERVARFIAPSRAIGAAATAEGIDVLYESSEVVGYDRDGKVARRVHLGGRGLSIASDRLRGSVVATTHGVFGLGELSSAALSDLDVYTELARILLEAKELDAALAAVDFAVARLAGGTAELFEIEARIWAAKGKPKYEAALRGHAKTATDPTQPLSPRPVLDSRDAASAPKR
ncbi:MAG: hypothetical protein HYV07_21860 [Deltaproteobacteria bacterium]|nr:hypothetical protein [Deltaproteobacteria bacterium]